MMLFILVFLPKSPAWAQLPPTADAYVNETNSTNYGTTNSLIVSNPNYEAFIQFDLSGLPSGTTGASVGKATLVLYASAVTAAGSFDVYEVGAPWTELTISGTKEPVLGTLVTPGVPVTLATKNNFVVIDVTPAVKDWLNGTVANYGLALQPNGSAVNVTFNSKENGAASHAPQLNISLIEPPGDITQITAGPGLTGGGTSGNVTLGVDSTQVPFLSFSNTFTASQTVNGTLTASSFSGNGAGVTNVNAAMLDGFTSAAFQPAGSYAVTTGPNTFAADQTLNAALNLAQTTGPDAGVINLGGNSLIHACCPKSLQNTFVGSSAGNFTADASGSNGGNGQNTAVGFQALQSLTSGFDNTANGFQALASNSTGGSNTADGLAALLNNTTGTWNVAIGNWSGDNLKTGSWNIAIGGFAGSNFNSNESNNIDISSNGVVGDSGAIRIGTGGTQTKAFIAGITGVTPAGGNPLPVVIDGNGQLGTGTSAVGTVTSVGSGAGLTGGPITTSGTLSLDTSFTDGRYAQLSAPNTFTANQTVPNLAATGVVSGSSASFSGGNPAVSGTSSGTGVYGSGGTYGVYGSVSGNGTIYGVYGTGSGNGNNYGVYGSGYDGVYGNGAYLGLVGYGGGYGLWSTGGFAGVYGQTTNYAGVEGSGGSYGVLSIGNFAATGFKSAIVPLPDDRLVSLYAVESPENWFEDFGTAELHNGVAEVTLDPTFAQTVSTEAGYHVFLTPNGDCEGLYVAAKSAGGFIVRELRGGKSEISFDYRIVARRKGYEKLRLQEVQADADTVQALREQAQSLATSKPPKLIIPKAPPEPPGSKLPNQSQ